MAFDAGEKKLPPLPDLDMGVATAEHMRLALPHAANLLRRGGVRHLTDYKEHGWATAKLSDIAGFNMSGWQVQTDCGTVACIGGLCQALLNAGDAVDSEDRGLVRLFYPHVPGAVEGFWGAITPLQAADAIDNLLATGNDPQWSKVLGRTE